MVAVLMSQLKLAAMVLLSKLARAAARPAALAAGRAGPRTVRALPHLGFRRFSSNGPPKGCAASSASSRSTSARSGKLYRARSRLYRSQILQENMHWKALAEIYTMHSFAQL